MLERLSWCADYYYTSSPKCWEWNDAITLIIWLSITIIINIWRWVLRRLGYTVSFIVIFEAILVPNAMTGHQWYNIPVWPPQCDITYCLGAMFCLGGSKRINGLYIYISNYNKLALLLGCVNFHINLVVYRVL